MTDEHLLMELANIRLYSQRLTLLVDRLMGELGAPQADTDCQGRGYYRPGHPKRPAVRKPEWITEAEYAKRKLEKMGNQKESG